MHRVGSIAAAWAKGRLSRAATPRAATAVKRGLRAALRPATAVLPLPVRRTLAVWIGARRWLPRRAHWLSVALLRDFAARDADACHRFLWTHHLGYAESYEVARRFGARHINETRHMLFADLVAHLRARGIAPATDIRAVFEVGCSLGYLLRFLETEVFPAATTLEGLDIDQYAVRQGQDYLAGQGSRVRLIAADMGDLDRVCGERTYDVIVCAGVLMYLQQASAAQVVEAMLRHANTVVALAGLAHPTLDNALLPRSTTRASDLGFIHNLDEMVRAAGGEVVGRRWEGQRLVNGNTVYFVLAAPASGR